ncbi:hypothetical protein O3M35_009052 [Rhynocoris fuscipes]|uniref:Synaptonemal complex protein 2 Spt16M-like domain-containing protein n=1 Tax=Rhynocoris fuscipes TaxID=488301 RepID=A0AAW1D8I3_9HEMI
MSGKTNPNMNKSVRSHISFLKDLEFSARSMKTQNEIESLYQIVKKQVENSTNGFDKDGSQSLIYYTIKLCETYFNCTNDILEANKSCYNNNGYDFDIFSAFKDIADIIAKNSPKQSGLFLKHLFNFVVKYVSAEVATSDFRKRRSLLFLFKENFYQLPYQQQKNIIESDQNLMCRLANLIFECGDYSMQEAILEMLIVSVEDEKRLSLFNKWFIKYPQIINKINVNYHRHFYKTWIRTLLVDVNNSEQFTKSSLSRVFSVPCTEAYADNHKLQKPLDHEYKEFWVDFSQSSADICIDYYGGDKANEWKKLVIEFVHWKCITNQREGKYWKLTIELRVKLEVCINSRIIEPYAITLYFKNSKSFNEVRSIFFGQFPYPYYGEVGADGQMLYSDSSPERTPELFISTSQCLDKASGLFNSPDQTSVNSLNEFSTPEQQPPEREVNAKKSHGIKRSTPVHPKHYINPRNKGSVINCNGSIEDISTPLSSNSAHNVHLSTNKSSNTHCMTENTEKVTNHIQNKIKDSSSVLPSKDIVSQDLHRANRVDNQLISFSDDHLSKNDSECSISSPSTQLSTASTVNEKILTNSVSSQTNSSLVDENNEITSTQNTVEKNFKHTSLLDHTSKINSQKKGINAGENSLKTIKNSNAKHIVKETKGSDKNNEKQAEKRISPRAHYKQVTKNNVSYKNNQKHNVKEAKQNEEKIVQNLGNVSAIELINETSDNKVKECKKKLNENQKESSRLLEAKTKQSSKNDTTKKSETNKKQDTKPSKEKESKKTSPINENLKRNNNQKKYSSNGKTVNEPESDNKNENKSKIDLKSTVKTPNGSQEKVDVLRKSTKTEQKQGGKIIVGNENKIKSFKSVGKSEKVKLTSPKTVDKDYPNSSTNDSGICTDKALSPMLSSFTDDDSSGKGKFSNGKTTILNTIFKGINRKRSSEMMTNVTEDSSPKKLRKLSSENINKSKNSPKLSNNTQMKNNKSNIEKDNDEGGNIELSQNGSDDLFSTPVINLPTKTYSKSNKKSYTKRDYKNDETFDKIKNSSVNNNGAFINGSGLKKKLFSSSENDSIIKSSMQDENKAKVTKTTSHKGGGNDDYEDDDDKFIPHEAYYYDEDRDYCDCSQCVRFNRKTRSYKRIWCRNKNRYLRKLPKKDYKEIETSDDGGSVSGKRSTSPTDVIASTSTGSPCLFDLTPEKLTASGNFSKSAPIWASTPNISADFNPLKINKTASPFTTPKAIPSTAVSQGFNRESHKEEMMLNQQKLSKFTSEMSQLAMDCMNTDLKNKLGLSKQKEQSTFYEETLNSAKNVLSSRIATPLRSQRTLLEQSQSYISMIMKSVEFIKHLADLQTNNTGIIENALVQPITDSEMDEFEKQLELDNYRIVYKPEDALDEAAENYNQRLTNLINKYLQKQSNIGN